jgi:hypothetical protein
VAFTAVWLVAFTAEIVKKQMDWKASETVCKIHKRERANRVKLCKTQKGKKDKKSS